MNLLVKEIFYSLQGEGGRQGSASIFIRLSGCNLACSYCDTDFANGTVMSREEILTHIKQFNCRWIIWTGGEPMLQLDDGIFTYFKKNGFFQAIESNGYFPLSGLLDYTVISPKGDVRYAKRINRRVDEIRLPVQKGDLLPDLSVIPEATNYFISPVFTDDVKRTQVNIDYCVSLIKQNNRWRLSVQLHKLIGIE